MMDWINHPKYREPHFRGTRIIDYYDLQQKLSRVGGGMKVICWSGGKDSTATVILAHENNIKIDKIVMSEVMFDKSKGVSNEDEKTYGICAKCCNTTV